MASDGLIKRLLSILLALSLAPVWAQQGKLEQATELVNQGFSLMFQATPASDEQALGKWEQALQLCVELENLPAQHDVWMAIGVLHYSRIRPEPARQAYQAALDLAEKAEDVPRQALALKSLGDVEVQEGDFEAAKEFYAGALEKKRLPDILFSVARLRSKMGHTEEAISLYRECLEGLPRARQPITLTMLGALYLRKGDSELALECYELALEIQAEAGDRIGQIFTLSSLGDLERSRGALEAAESYYTKALALEPNPEQQYSLYTGLSMVALLRTSVAASLPYCEKALESARLSGSQALLVRASISMASTLNAMGRNQEALESLEVARDAPTPELRIQALRRQAAIERDLGMLNESSGHLDDALETARKSQMTDLLGALHLSKAELYSRRGHFPPALEQLKAARSVAEARGDRKALAEVLLAEFRTTLLWLEADFHTARGQLRGARVGLKKAAEIYQELGDLSGEVEVVLAQARLEFEAAAQDPEGMENEAERLALAQDLAELALARAKTADLAGATATARNLLARIALLRRDFEEAVVLFRAEYQRAVEGGSALELGTALSNLGNALTNNQQFDEAARVHQREYELYRELGHREGMAQASHRQAQVEFFSGDLEAAVRYEDRAVEIVESMRLTLPDETSRVNFYQLNHRFYEHQIFYRLERLRKNPDYQDFEEVFAGMEGWRARSLIEFLSGEGVPVETGLSPQQLARWDELEGELGRLEAQPPVQEEERSALLSQFEELRRAGSRGFSSVVSLSDVQKMLDKESVVLFYGFSSYKITFLTVTWDGVSVHQAVANRDEVVSVLRAWQRANRRRASGEEQAAQLGELLLPDIRDYKRLIVIADGALQQVPFSALIFEGKRVVESHEVVYLPSCSLLAHFRAQQAQRTSQPQGVMVVADPVFQASDPRLSESVGEPSTLGEFETLSLSRAGRRSFKRLPATRGEAGRLIELMGAERATVAFGFEATRERILKDLSQSAHQIVHYATHGVSSTSDPGLSSLVLSLFDSQGQPLDGFLRVADISNMKLSADLVVLSACETAVGQIFEDEGVLGLARAFIYAGAPRLVVSQWTVDDEATAALMTAFYEGLIEQELPPGEALQRAQLEVAGQPRWASPYYWAAFQLVGDWEKFPIDR